jgi:hypothetical protein
VAGSIIPLITTYGDGFADMTAGWYTIPPFDNHIDVYFTSAANNAIKKTGDHTNVCCAYLQAFA